jgi:hemerythrin-like domain-containing protein
VASIDLDQSRAPRLGHSAKNYDIHPASETVVLTAQEAALVTIQHEHLSLAQVLHTLRAFLQRIEAGVAAPEFDMFSTALYYIDDFQERCHHPKEEEHIFKALNAATDKYSEVIDRLQSGHRYGAQAMAELYRSLVHFQGGAPKGLEKFRANVDTYAAAMFEHMRVEDDLFERCIDTLNEDAWGRIAAAFDENDDPLFGIKRRDEFARLFRRIQRLAPRKLKHGLMADSVSPDLETR